MHTVIETPGYLEAAEDAGMTEEEQMRAVNAISANPSAGDVVKGTGGCRKVRLAGRGKGKSGGYRMITYFAHKGVPVFLVTVFSKGERSDLTPTERQALRKLSKQLLASLGARAVDARKGVKA